MKHLLLPLLLLAWIHDPGQKHTRKRPLCNVAVAGKIHLLIFSDTQTLKSPSQADTANIFQWVRKISLYTKMGVEVYNRENAFTSESADSALNKISLQKDDVVVFYYTGHGYRFKRGNDSKYPYLGFYDNTARRLAGNRLSLSNIHERMKSKGARLTITIGDLCNEAIDVEPAEYLGIKIADAYTRLFVRSHGDIIAASCDVGQRSSGYSSDGGLFTSKFMEVFYEEVKRTTAPDWADILAKTTKRVEHKMKRQTPVYDCNVTYE